MQLRNEFVVGTGIDDAWAILTDVERIAPCLPGATLEGRDGDDYLASVKVKVGPIAAHFRGLARFTYIDPVGHCAVVSATGKDPRGTATAAAQIRLQLEAIEPTQTRVMVDTELDITGRIAQFGRGAIADISTRFLGQFVDNLSDQILGRSQAGPGHTTVTMSESREPVADNRNGADLDVMALVLPELRKRYGQVLAGALLGFALSWVAFGRKVVR